MNLSLNGNNPLTKAIEDFLNPEPNLQNAPDQRSNRFPVRCISFLDISNNTTKIFSIKMSPGHRFPVSGKQTANCIFIRRTVSKYFNRFFEFCVTISIFSNPNTSFEREQPPVPISVRLTEDCHSIHLFISRYSPGVRPSSRLKQVRRYAVE